MAYVESSQPQEYKPLLSQSTRLYRIGFNKTFGLALLIALIAFLPRIMDFVKGRNVLEVMPLVDPNPWLFLLNICCLLLFIIILERLEFSIEHKRDRLNKDVILSLKKFPWVFIGSLVQTLVFVLLSLAFLGFFIFLRQSNLLYTQNPVQIGLIIMPFMLQLFIEIFLFFSLIFYTPLIVTENFGPVQSLLRSFKLVWGNWWRTVKFQLTPWVCYLLCLGLLRYGANINLHLYYSPQESTTLLAMLVHILIFALFIPWFASTMLVQLHDLELRYNLAAKPRHTKPRKKITSKKS